MKAVIFDLDGTIVDNQNVLLRAFKVAFEAVEEKFPGEENVRLQFGKDLETILETFSLDRNKFDKFKSHFSQYLKENGGSKIVPGMVEVLDWLKNEDYVLGLVTSKSRDLVRDELNELDLNRFFDVVIDESSTKMHKPHPEPLLKACEYLGVAPSRTIPYVGDSRFDMLAACTAGLLPIGVTWGVHGELVNENIPSQCPVPKKVSTPNELKHFLKNLLT